MNLMLVVIGLFILAAIAKNRDLWDNDDNEATYTFISIVVIFLVFGGLGFLLPSSMDTVASFSFLIPAQVFTAVIGSVTGGRAAAIATAASMAILAYIIMGAFM